MNKIRCADFIRRPAPAGLSFRLYCQTHIAKRIPRDRAGYTLRSNPSSVAPLSGISVSLRHATAEDGQATQGMPGKANK